MRQLSRHLFSAVLLAALPACSLTLPDGFSGFGLFGDDAQPPATEAAETAETVPASTATPASATEAATGAPAAKPQAQLPPAAKPVYQPGDVYIYDDDGQTAREQVVGVSPDRVTWTNDSGLIWTTTGQVVTPQLSWSSHPELGRGRQVVIGDPDTLFPLEEGRTTAFRIRGSSEKVQAGWEDNLSCAVTGQEAIAVRAGTFDTYRIECMRDAVETSIWYAPEVSNYVLRERLFSGTRSRKELVSFEAAAEAPGALAAVPGAEPEVLATEVAADWQPGPGDITDPVILLPGAAAEPEVAPETVHQTAPEATKAKSPASGPDGLAVPARNHKSTEDTAKADSSPDSTITDDDTARLTALLSRLDTAISRLEKLPEPQEASGTTAAAKTPPTAPAPQRSKGKFGIHLESYRSEAGARRGWATLQKRFPEELKPLEAKTIEFDAGDGRGTFVRLVGAAFTTRAGASRVCDALKSKKQQYCKAVRVAR